MSSDFGFALITDPVIGNRTNDLEACWPILKKYMPEADFARLKTGKAPKDFLIKLQGEAFNEF